MRTDRVMGGSVKPDSLTRTEDRDTKTCGISNGRHFFFKMWKTLRQEGKPDRKRLVCEWCYKTRAECKGKA